MIFMYNEFTSLYKTDRKLNFCLIPRRSIICLLLFANDSIVDCFRRLLKAMQKMYCLDARYPFETQEVAIFVGPCELKVD